MSKRFMTAGSVVAVALFVALTQTADVSARCTAPGSLDTHLCYAAWHSSYSSRASIGV